MTAFVDPRVEAAPESPLRSPARLTTQRSELDELHQLCRCGRLYDVERWIKDGQPLQLAARTRKGQGKSALSIAIETGNYALVLLLLANGYAPNEEIQSPLDVALRNRRLDLVHLLLDWGTDPQSVCLSDVFDSYSIDVFERFRLLGVDLTAGHALAEAIAYHTSNKPLLGFAKRYRTTDHKIQSELDIALAHHAGEGNEKGVQLCLWAGADPHTPVPSLRFRSGWSTDAEGDDPDRFLGFSAIYEACRAGHHEIFKRLGPDPTKDDLEELWEAAGDPAVMDVLAPLGLPVNVGAVIRHHMWWATFTSGSFGSGSFGSGSRWASTLRRLFEIGVRWKESTPDEIGTLRRFLLKASDFTFVDLMKLLATSDYCSPDILKELARTPSMLGRMKKVGFIPSNDQRASTNYYFRPTRAREVLQKCGIVLPKPKQPLPRIVTVGTRHSRIDLTREELFERVWATPIMLLAKEWGISGPGLKKTCVRMAVPVPPRGYWAKLKAGKPVRRGKLPTVKP